MKKKIRWITETAAMLALLVALQAVTKPMGQLVTGSFVNTVLAVAALVAGLSSGIVVALISPVLAYLLGIAPQIITVPAIMVGNSVYVLLLTLIAGKNNGNLPMRAVAWVSAAVAKFGVLYGMVVGLICGVFGDKLVEAGVLKEQALKMLPATFSWPQLITALIGGALALLMVPTLRKVLHR